MNRIQVIIIFSLFSFSVFAQNENSDSLRVNKDDLEKQKTVFSNESYSKPQWQRSEVIPLNRHQYTANSELKLKVPDLNLKLTDSPYLFRWRNGGLVGSVSSEVLPGMMGIESGGFALTQDFGKFSIAAYGEALKYGYYGGLSRSFGFGGSMTYRANEKLSFTLFGSYYTSPGFATPAMAGYMNIPTFGGYMDYKFNDHWGMKVGAQSYRSMYGNHWQTQPILTPYYRVSKDVELGIDVGGILYQLLELNKDKKMRHYGNPTMGPPSAPVLNVGPAMPPPPHN